MPSISARKIFEPMKISTTDMRILQIGEAVDEGSQREVERTQTQDREDVPRCRR